MSAEPEERVRYVVAGMPTGWAAMSKTIRDVDEDKVKDYKEDIDTLLVFTGLFSAVLTAFVIVSYPLLSPDPQDSVAQYLAQISAQTNSYSVIAGTISSTVPPLSLSSAPFEPSLPALRINYLWFSSLIITLITASFSMLVKQWLREYLAFDYTSPHERLRARQFRYPGLSTWKVYQIAGVLPLLLQLALALFFLGICFFTKSVDHGIGDMCTVLVSLWAACFVTATIAPVVSPRCPYKTALLKNVMVTIRPRLRPIFLALARRFRRCVVAARRRLQLQPYSEALLSGILVISRAATAGASVDAPFPPIPARELSFVEEAEAIKLNTDELSMLAEVDAFLLDDDLLGTTMLDSLTQSYMEPSALIKFVLQAISLRLRGDELIQPLSSPPDLRRLPKRAWIAVSDIVAATIKNGLQANATTAGSWVQDAVYLLLSVSEQPFTPSARSAILRAIRGVTLPQVTKVLSGPAPSPTAAARFHDLLSPMSTQFQQLLSQQDVQPADVVAFILSFLSIEARFAIPALPLTSTLDLRSVSEPIWQFSSNVLAATIEETLGPDRKGQEIGLWYEDAIRILLSPSSYPLTSAGNKALARACLEDAPYQRLGACIRQLGSPDHESFAHTLSRLQGVLQQIFVEGPAQWLLREIVSSIPCTARCTQSDDLAPLLADHAPGHDEWTKHFTSILVERCRAIFDVVDGLWPPGSTESFRALISLPLSSHALNPEIPEVVFALICSLQSSAGALQNLVSVDMKWRSWIVQDAAVSCVVSLVVNTNTEGRRKLIHAIWKACNDYLSERERTKYPQVGAINLVRHVVLASRIHAEVQLDDGLFRDWSKYYTTCAKAMSIFRTTKYPTLPDEEKADTVRLAEECLAALDEMEPTTEEFGQWEAIFDAEASVFPDAIFQELVAFVADGDAVARKSKRVRRLRKIGAIPGGEVPLAVANEPARSPPAAVVDGPEGAKSAGLAGGGEGAEDESSLQSASSGLVVSSVRELEGVGSAPREVEGDIVQDTRPDLSAAAAHEGVGQTNPSAASTDNDAAVPSNKTSPLTTSFEDITVRDTKSRERAGSDAPREQLAGVVAGDEGKDSGGEIPLTTASLVHDDEERGKNAAPAGESPDELVLNNASSSPAVSSSPEEICLSGISTTVGV